MAARHAELRAGSLERDVNSATGRPRCGWGRGVNSNRGAALSGALTGDGGPRTKLG